MISPADHLLTLEEFQALPEDNSRHYELQDGVLIVRPNPGVAHQRVVSGLMMSLHEQLPRPWSCLFGVEVLTRREFPSCVRVPDLVVYSEDVVDMDAPMLESEQVLAAVEVVSPGSWSTDTVLKPVEYAAAGVRHYWLVEPEPEPVLTEYRLVGSNYQRAARMSGEFETTEPFPLRIELTALTSRRVWNERKVDQ